MRCGLRKIDKTMMELVNKAKNSGRWVEKWGRKHMKLVLRDMPSRGVAVAGSSRDPAHAALNLRSDIRRIEREVGFDEYSV